MIRNYLKIAWRNIVKSKGHTFINVAGLSIGMAVAMLIGLWIWDELSFNKYHQNYDRVGELMTTQTSNGEVVTFPTTVVPLSEELRSKYGNDFKLTALTWAGTHIMAVGDKKISQNGTWAEAGLPQILSLKMIKGNYAGFNDPSNFLLSQSVATALFGDADPINKVVCIDNKTDMKVAGVYEDLPKNTSFYNTQFMLPWANKANWWNIQTTAWGNHGCNLYVLMNEHANFDKVSAKIRNITKPHFKMNDEVMAVHPMSKWHLYSEFVNGKSVGGAIKFVWLFGLIGMFVLLLACINFMNLSTAKSEKRAKEVGIRKAIGSVRGQLIKQFLSESLLVVFLALGLTFILVILALPYFNQIADKDVHIPYTNAFFWVGTLSFSIFTGLLSGSYPAFYLSAFNPVKVLKGTFKVGKLASLPRKILVVVQFTVSIVLIIGTIIVLRQINYAKNRPVGYSRAGLITIEMNTPDIYGHYETLRNDLLQTGAVSDMAEANSPTTQIWSNNGGFDWEGKTPGPDPTFGTIGVTYDFGNTVGWKVVEGRDFSRKYATDTSAIILNQSAVKLSGIKNPVGKLMRWGGKSYVIAGVVKDMIMESPYNKTVATIFLMNPYWVNNITIRIKPNMPVHDALAKIEGVFKRYNPGSPFDFKFNDDEYARKFATEERVGNLASVFAGLAIFISCLGLFGLASFVAEQRVKEIGVRKVLGASIVNLWRLLSAEFVLLVTISLLIAVPVAYYFMNGWLQQYQYKEGITWWIFAFAGIGAIAITLATVSFQAIKAALANPVKSLRSE
ncbi:ABC transporter permease [Mucilaginibacter flavus]|uniref:ABC transporter permease n=1 Tax=Mucilaginibacter flavus TaxID=931504 RepID=UPI0025B5AA35|nr:ABC transporter permease [Mucilaginibacter flavus]MDN3581527.1 ABC transporter permease [Mucilaginibacter flavus]